MSRKLHVIGVGAGNGDYLLPIALKQIEKCDLLIGGERLLKAFLKPQQEFFYLKANLGETAQYIKNNYQIKETGILVSGDPGFYSFLSFLKKHFKKEELNVIPGISSLSLAFARLSETWHDAVLLSLHGRSLASLSAGQLKGKLALLTDYDNTPPVIARRLYEILGEDRQVAICEALGTPEEKITKTRLVEVEGYYGLSVMVIYDET